MEMKWLFGGHTVRRILYLSRGGSIGGSQRQLYYVITNLDRRVYKPIVVCPKDGQFVAQLQDSGVKTCILPLRPWRKFPAALHRYMDAEHLTRFARQHEVALIHNSDLWLNGYMIWAAGRLKVPSILHVRTPILPDDVHKHRCSRATSIIAISQRVKQDLLRAEICPEKIVQIDDGVDLEHFKSEVLDANILRRDYPSHEEVLVGIVGRIDPSKRQLDFLKAAGQIMRDSTRNVTFFLIGEVRSRSYFKQISRFVGKNGLKQHVVVTGRRDDMPQVLSSLDIIVSLSGGAVMFEAMACSKPVISAGFSTREGSIHIQDGHTGILVESKQNSALVETLMRLIDNSELRVQIGLRARKWAQSNFSHIRMADSTQRLYSQLLQG